MLQTLLFLAAVLLPLVSVVRAEVPAEDGYKLVWSDEFDQDGPPDLKNWTFEQGFVRNKELQWYQPDNACCKGGKLIIEGRREHKPNPNYKKDSTNWKTNRQFIEYTSASVITRDRHSWKFGRFEVRVKIDISPGMWPAIWTVGDRRNDGRRWPGCGEIDIMEYYRGMILANAFWAKADRRPAGDTSKTPIEKLTNRTPAQWAEDFHTWCMEWDESEIRIYLDDRLLNTIDLSKTINKTPDGKNPFHEPHYLLLNLAMGGAGGDPAKTQFPVRYEIDYVRVYQKVESPTPG